MLNTKKFASFSNTLCCGMNHRHLNRNHRWNNPTDAGFIKQAPFNNASNNVQTITSNVCNQCYICPIIKYKRQFQTEHQNKHVSYYNHITYYSHYDNVYEYVIKYVIV